MFHHLSVCCLYEVMGFLTPPSQVPDVECFFLPLGSGGECVPCCLVFQSYIPDPWGKG